jgi:hypothetical protein
MTKVEPSGDDTLTEILTDLAFVSDGISDEALQVARTQLLQYIEGSQATMEFASGLIAEATRIKRNDYGSHWAGCPFSEEITKALAEQRQRLR